MRSILIGSLAAASASFGQACQPQWTALGDGVNSEVYSLGRSGTGVLAGGAFTQAGSGQARHLAVWQGASWSEFGGGLWAPANTLAARALLNYDDGSGPALYAAGDFIEAGGTSAYYIARWRGTGWTALGPGTSASVYAMAAFDPGGGQRLYAGGEFVSPAQRIAAWDGAAWSPLGAGVSGGVNPSVRALVAGPGVLYVGGEFTSPAASVAAWNGAAWSALGTGLTGAVHALAVFQGSVYAGGEFTIPGGGSRLARWDGQTWSLIGGGVSGPNFPAVLALAASASGVYVGGRFDTVGFTPANSVALWDGQSWSVLGAGLSGGLNPWVNTLLVVQEPGGEALYAGGGFGDAGGVPAQGIARRGCPLPPPCYADCNNDGVLGLSDFGCFQSRFGLGDPYADCNGDTALNLADFGCFQTRFALGCP